MQEGWLCGICCNGNGGKKIICEQFAEILEHFESHLAQYEQGSDAYLSKLQELIQGLRFYKEGGA